MEWLGCGVVGVWSGWGVEWLECGVVGVWSGWGVEWLGCGVVGVWSGWGVEWLECGVVGVWCMQENWLGDTKHLNECSSVSHSIVSCPTQGR